MRVFDFIRQEELEKLPDGRFFVLANGGVRYCSGLGVDLEPRKVNTDTIRDIENSTTDMLRFSGAIAGGDEKSATIAVFTRFEPWDWIIGAAVEARVMFRRVQTLRRSSVLSAVFAGIAGSAVLLGFAFSIARPVRRLQIALTLVRDGDLSTRVDDKSRRDELGELSRFFNTMVSRIQDYAKNLESMVQDRTRQLQEANALLLSRNDELEVANRLVRQKNLDIGQSIQFAGRIQRSMLSSDSALSEALPDHFIIFRPKESLSGDFHWVGKSESNTIVVVADCTGHGVPGSLLTMIAISHLRRLVIEEQILDPGAILCALNERLLSEDTENHGDFGTDLALLRISERQVTAATAHSRIYLTSEAVGGKAEIITGDRSMLGSRRYKTKPVWSTFEVESAPGSMLYLTTDGFLDQYNDAGHRLGRPHFSKLLREICVLPTSQQKELLTTRLEEFRGNAPQRDDITVLGWRIP